MRRKWLRLLVCVNVTTFLVANTHAGSVAAARLLAPQHAGHVSHSREHSEPCSHCAGHASLASTTPDEEEDGTPSCPGCPDGPKCPCPGGCALCSIAKVPHSTPGICLTCPSTDFEIRLPDPSPIYTSPFASRLIRPPRV